MSNKLFFLRSQNFLQLRHIKTTIEMNTVSQIPERYFTLNIRTSFERNGGSDRYVPSQHRFFGGRAMSLTALLLLLLLYKYAGRIIMSRFHKVSRGTAFPSGWFFDSINGAAEPFLSSKTVTRDDNGRIVASFETCLFGALIVEAIVG